MAALCTLFSFGHRKCKRDLHLLMQAALDDNKRIVSLNNQVTELINQVQELKAVYDYQTLELEQKIGKLEKQREICRARKKENKHITTSSKC